MSENDLLSQADYKELLLTIKSEKELWIENLSSDSNDFFNF